MENHLDWKLNDALRALRATASDGYIILTEEQAQTLDVFFQRVDYEEAATEEIEKVQRLARELLETLCRPETPGYEIVIRRHNP